MQQSDQDIPLNGLQFINPNLLSPACLQGVSNFSVSNWQLKISLSLVFPSLTRILLFKFAERDG